jgi:alpha/beta hydrolase family protein DUF900
VTHPTWLSARSPYRGQQRAQKLQIRDTPQARKADHHTILIHGYQNSETKATSSYRDFERALRESASGIGALGTVWHFHWPGSHEGKITSVRTYAARIAAAELAAALLVRDFLAKLKPRQEVSLVAHSLGCRLALAVVAEIHNAQPAWKGAQIKHVALLAAAVPQKLCLAPYMFRTRLSRSTEHVYFSHKDRALGWAFNAGQKEYGEFGEAVGRDGRPLGRWSRDINADLYHGQYWPAALVAEGVSGELAAVTPPRRPRTWPEAASEAPPLPVPRRTPSTREPTTRSMP